MTAILVMIAIFIFFSVLTWIFEYWWFLIPAFIACVVISIKFPSDNQKNGSSRKSRPSSKTYFDDDDDEYVTRAQRRREEEKRKKEERARRKWYDDYDTFTDKDGNEHSLDYDNYCDECDEYHEE